MAWPYTTVRHKQRIQLGLSNDEYCLLDLIHRRATSPGPVQGWCITSKDTICEELGYAKSTLKRMIKKMIDLGYLIKSKDGKRKKATAQFYNVAYAEEMQTGGQSGPKGEKTGGQDEPQDGAKVNPIGGQSDPQQGAKVDPSNITLSIEEVISNIGEHGSPNEKPVFFAKLILNFLSQKTGKRFIIPDDDSKFRGSGKFAHINARFRDGYTLENFRDVIEAKTREWLDNTKMNQYLVPDTLFRKNNFERYLDAAQNFDTAPNEKQAKINSQKKAKEELTKLFKAHKGKWKQKYTNQAQTDYIEALRLFYLDNPKLKPNGSTTP